jgi:hypothetical protein
MKLTRHDLDFLKRLRAEPPRWSDIGAIGQRMAEGKLVACVDGLCVLTDAGRSAIERAQLARLA